jgi:thiol-disulfide isomerase/thioredoxin
VSPKQVTKPSLVLYYMPTCPACVRAKPEVIKIADSVSIPTYAVDVTRYNRIPEAISGGQVTYVPKLVALRGNEAVVYDGVMKADKIANFVRTQFDDEEKRQLQRNSWMVPRMEDDMYQDDTLEGGWNSRTKSWKPSTRRSSKSWKSSTRRSSKSWKSSTRRSTRRALRTRHIQ